MTWIKICGTTSLEDALTSVDAGADALGFVFYEQSPRRMDPEAVREIVKKVPPEIERVGVFVSESVERSGKIAEYCGLTAVQLYVSGDRNLPASSGLACKLFVASPARLLLDDPRRFSARQLDGERIDALFVDSGTAQRPGGTGAPFDWRETAPAID